MLLDEYEPQWMRNRTCATRLMLIDHTKSLTVWWYLRSGVRWQSEEGGVRVAPGRAQLHALLFFAGLDTEGRKRDHDAGSADVEL